jgi:RNA polymerase sigma factor (sigma-70 family)
MATGGRGQAWNRARRPGLKKGVRTLARSVPEAQDRPSVGADGSVEALFRSSYVAMVRLATFLVGRTDVAEELVQDAFVRVAPKLGAIDAPRAYLRVAVVNACRSWQRKQGRERSAISVLAGDREPVVSERPCELTDALARLRERQRAAIVLRYWDDLPEGQIAELLGCRPGTVKSLLSRGLDALRQELGGDDA